MAMDAVQLSDLASAAFVIGRIIETVRMTADNNALQIVFADGSELKFEDIQQGCCEDRWMSCDDDLQSFTGDKYLGWEVMDVILDVPRSTHPREQACHDVQFLHIRTSGGTIVCQSHVDHSGNYGGFDIVATLTLNSNKLDGKEIN